MFKKLSLLLSFLLCVLMFSEITLAAPFWFPPETITQPTGETFIRSGFGDEFGGCFWDQNNLVVELGPDNFWYYNEIVMSKLIKNRVKCAIDPVPSTAITSNQYFAWIHQKPCVSFKVDGQIGVTHYTSGYTIPDWNSTLDFTSPVIYTVKHFSNNGDDFVETWTATCVVLDKTADIQYYGISFSDPNNTPVTTIINNTFLCATVMLENNDTKNAPVTIVTSLYNRDGKLKKTSIKQYAIMGNDPTPRSFSNFIALPNDTNDDYIKVFILNDLDNITPYEEPIQFPYIA